MIIEAILHTVIVVAERVASRLVSFIPTEAAEHVLTIVGSYGIPLAQFFMHWFTPLGLAAIVSLFLYAIGVWGTVYTMKFVKLVRSWLP